MNLTLNVDIKLDKLNDAGKYINIFKEVNKDILFTFTIGKEYITQPIWDKDRSSWNANSWNAEEHTRILKSILKFKIKVPVEYDSIKNQINPITTFAKYFDEFVEKIQFPGNHIENVSKYPQQYSDLCKKVEKIQPTTKNFVSGSGQNIICT